MKTVYERLSGRVREDTVLMGATDGAVIVESGVRLSVDGAVGSRLEIEAGAEVEVNGVVVGPVTNRGLLRVAGMILGDVRDIDGGRTTQDLGEARLHIVPPHPRAERARRLSDSIIGPATIREDMVVDGSISGPVTVASGVFLQLNGSVSGVLIIEAGADVALHGSVSGEIRNRGHLDVYGTVSGLIVDESGQATVHEGSRL